MLTLEIDVVGRLQFVEIHAGERAMNFGDGSLQPPLNGTVSRLMLGFKQWRICWTLCFK